MTLAAGAWQQAPPGASRVPDAEGIVDAIVAGKFTAVMSRFDATMKASITEEALRNGWASTLAQVGAFVRRGTAREEPNAQYRAVLIPCEFERGKLDLTVVFDAAGAIAGLSMRPAASPYVPPPYVDAAKYTERAVTVGSGEWALPGTLAIPAGAGPFPAVILVHGSGPNDRDGSVGPNKPLKDLALGLATQGIAVVRYDKRTLTHATRVAPLKQFTVKEETIDDALAALALLRNEPLVDKDRIYVLGHSLGGMVAPRIAADVRLAGMIVMAGAVRPLAQSILEQYDYLFRADGKVSEAEQKELDVAKQLVADVAKLTPADAASGRIIGGAPASYWLDLRGFDPPAAAAALTKRILVLQGARDYQVTVADFEKWKAALGSRPNATLRLYPALNHLFLPGEGKSLPAEYSVPGHVPVDVIRDIAEFVQKR
jgi:dienelactone hydrolase